MIILRSFDFNTIFLNSTFSILITFKYIFIYVMAFSNKKILFHIIKQLHSHNLLNQSIIIINNNTFNNS